VLIRPIGVVLFLNMTILNRRNTVISLHW